MTQEQGRIYVVRAVTLALQLGVVWAAFPTLLEPFGGGVADRLFHVPLVEGAQLLLQRLTVGWVLSILVLRLVLRESPRFVRLGFEVMTHIDRGITALVSRLTHN